MRLNLTAAVVAVGLCLFAGLTQAAVTGQWRAQLIRGSTTVGQGVGDTEAAAWKDCQDKIPRTATAPTVYACQTMRYYATVDPAGTARLTWTPPTQDINGTALSDLAGYRIYYGTSSQALTQMIQVPGPSVSAFEVSGLTPGTYYFALRSYISDGTESVLSNLASKVVN